MHFRPKPPANDTRDYMGESLQRTDLDNEFALKQAEERIARLKGPADSAGLRWMLRRLRMRLFGRHPGQ